MNLTKPKREPNLSRLRWCRKQPCLITKLTSGNEAHHVNEVGHGGMGTKASDFRTVPLQPWLHRLYHDIGRAAFEKQYNLDLESEIVRLNRKYHAEHPPIVKAERKHAMSANLHVVHCEGCGESHLRIPRHKLEVSNKGIEFTCVRKNVRLRIQ